MGNRDQASVSATGVMTVSVVVTIDATTRSASGILSVTSGSAPDVDRPSVSATNVLSVVPPGPDITAPTITSSNAISLAENVALSHTLTANEAVTWTKTGGADQALFTLAGSNLSMTAKDYENPADVGTNNTYVVQVTATDAATNATNQTITVTVTDAVEVPSAPTIGQWAVVDEEIGNTLRVNVSAATLLGGTLSDIEYRIDGGSAVSSGEGAIPAEFLILGLTDDVEVDIEIRLVTNGGTSGWSDLKSETPTAAASVTLVHVGDLYAEDGPHVISGSFDLGDAAADRSVFVVYGVQSGDATAPTVVANGVTLTDRVFTNGDPDVGIAAALVASGSGSLTVSVTWASASFQSKIMGVYVGRGLSSLTPKQTKDKGQTIAVDAGDFIVAVAMHIGQDEALTSPTEAAVYSAMIVPGSPGTFRGYTGLWGPIASTDAAFVTGEKTSGSVFRKASFA